MLWVPPGFAQRFHGPSQWTDVIYKVTDIYAPEWERTLAWNDPALGIPWPLINGGIPQLSPNDAAGTPLGQSETYDWSVPSSEATDSRKRRQ
jgi:dTDP-4-dehydrorhamnose 3,5-epimerase